MWPDRRLLNLFRIEHPILQAPMAGAMDAVLAIAVAKAGGLGAPPAAMLNAEKLRAQVAQDGDCRQAGQSKFLCAQTACAQ
jgi:nitronate monooxygenase